VFTGFFIDTFFLPWFGIDLKEKKATIVGDGSQPVSFTHRKDVGKLVTQLILKDQCAAIVRTGPETKTLNEAFKLFEQVKGAKLDIVKESISDVKKRNDKPEGDFMKKAVDSLKIIIAEGNAQNKQPIYSGGLDKFITLKEYFESV
jgi:nucleoside-diphosphate-sugar epimerase